MSHVNGNYLVKTVQICVLEVKSLYHYVKRYKLSFQFQAWNLTFHTK
jgi:hypothetical protein